MASKEKLVGVLVDPDTNHTLKQWSVIAGRSKRRHAAILMRRLMELFDTNPDDLKRLGLIETCTTK